MNFCSSINPSTNAANFNSSVFSVLFILFRMKNLHDSLLSWVTEEVERSVLKSSSFVTIKFYLATGQEHQVVMGEHMV
mgnify:CR=1 FL=1